jgi:hypothetical protein
LKPKVHTLTLENEYKLIGIASHLSPHKISWMFNQELGAKFQQADSLVIVEKEEYRFPVYKFEDDGDILYTLYANKLERSSIIKSIKKIDYILKCEGFISARGFEQYLDKLKKVKNILTAFEIELEQLKSKEKEVFN